MTSRRRCRSSVALLFGALVLLAVSCSLRSLFVPSTVTRMAAFPSTRMSCDKTAKPYFFTVCAVFKNEAVNLHEWISHYLLEGAEHIFLVDNGSEDNFVTIVQPFIDQGQVTVMANYKQHAQQEIFDHYILPILNATEWMLNVDLDEVVYARQGTTSDFLRRLPCSIATIQVPWKMFGSSGHKEHPGGSLVKNFLWRSSFSHPNCKSFFRSSMTTKFFIHTAEVTGETLRFGEACGGNVGCITATTGMRIGGNEANQEAGFMTSPNFLQLNHYAIQSLQWFVSTKMTRGDVLTGESDNVRNFGYFKSYDAGSNGTKDTELYQKHKQFYDSL